MNVKILAKSFNSIEPYSPKFASLFYRNLCDYLQIRTLLANNDFEKYEKFYMISLIALVKNIQDTTLLKKTLVGILEKHKTLANVILDNQQIIRDSFFKTLRECLKQNWNQEVEKSWQEAYQKIFVLLSEASNGYDLKKNSHYSGDKLRAKAIATKALREGGSTVSVTKKLLQDSYFKQAQQKLGKEKTRKLVCTVVRNASHKVSKQH